MSEDNHLFPMSVFVDKNPDVDCCRRHLKHISPTVSPDQSIVKSNLQTLFYYFSVVALCVIMLALCS